MPSLKFTPKNLEKLGIILMVILLVFRPGFIKKFSNNLIGKMLLLGGIVSVASHNKMYGLLAAFTYVVCVEMTSEGHPEKDKTNAGEAEKDETNAGEADKKDGETAEKEKTNKNKAATNMSKELLYDNIMHGSQHLISTTFKN